MDGKTALREWFLVRDYFLPPGVFGNVRRYVWLSQLRRRLVLESRRERSGPVLNTLQCTGQPLTTELSPDVNSDSTDLKVEKPCIQVSKRWSLSAFLKNFEKCLLSYEFLSWHLNNFIISLNICKGVNLWRIVNIDILKWNCYIILYIQRNLNGTAVSCQPAHHPVKSTRTSFSLRV